MSGFEDYKYCLPLGIVDLENDTFSLSIEGNDGVSNQFRKYKYRFRLYLKVCISSVFFNNNQVFFGAKNNLPNFSMDEDELTCIDNRMTSSSIAIRNGTVISSECQGLFAMTTNSLFPT